MSKIQGVNSYEAVRNSTNYELTRTNNFSPNPNNDVRWVIFENNSEAYISDSDYGICPNTLIGQLTTQQFTRVVTDGATVEVEIRAGTCSTEPTIPPTTTPPTTPPTTTAVPTTVAPTTSTPTTVAPTTLPSTTQAPTTQAPTTAPTTAAPTTQAPTTTTSMPTAPPDPTTTVAPTSPPAAQFFSVGQGNTTYYISKPLEDAKILQH